MLCGPLLLIPQEFLFVGGVSFCFAKELLKSDRTFSQKAENWYWLIRPD